MKDDNNNAANEAANDEVWPRKLNKLLIGIGVLAFGLIIADRLASMFRADDLPDSVEIVRDSNETQIAADSTEQKLEVAQAVDVVSDVADDSDQEGMQEAIDIEAVFGSRLKFVSASEPMYVVTGDERRIDIGGEIDEQTTLAGITNERVILEKGGNLLVISLPDPVSEP